MIPALAILLRLCCIHALYCIVHRKNQAAEIARLRAALSKLESSLAGERAAVRDAEARLTKARQEAQEHQQHLVS